MTTYTATYSAEDNKLRLYTDEWLEKELYQRLRDLDFQHAKHQKLFVAPKWTPAREDLCIELAGIITAEQTTLIERAEAKAKRLDDLADRREYQANAFYQAAEKMNERLQEGQPILIGHHSERKARREQDKIKSTIHQAEKAASAIQYWNWRAEGVERYANMKNDDGVRARRIKTLLAELRDRQRDINHAYICLDLWESIKGETDKERLNKLTEYDAGAQLATGAAAPYYQERSLWDHLRKGTMTPEAVIELCLNFHEKQANSTYTARWINHILNRLAFERIELGEIERFSGQVTATILQAFAREHGAHKPKAKKQGNQWQLVSSVPLPLHIGEGKELILSADEWCELMQASGYEVPAPKPKQPPLLNFRAGFIKARIWGGVEKFRQIELTKAEYSAIYEDYRGVKLSECGQFRFKICKHPDQQGYKAEWCAVFLTDSKAHPTIESDAIIYDMKEAN